MKIFKVCRFVVSYKGVSRFVRSSERFFKVRGFLWRFSRFVGSYDGFSMFVGSYKYFPMFVSPNEGFSRL